MPRLKPQHAPAIVIDTREQAPYQFDHPAERRKLDTGDYSIVGLERAVAVERKELGDFLNCIGQSRERFERELERSRGMRRLWVMVEGTLSQIAVGDYRSQVTPASVLGTIAAWENRFDAVRICFAGSRSLGQHMTYRLLIRAWMDDIQGAAA